MTDSPSRNPGDGRWGEEQRGFPIIGGVPADDELKLLLEKRFAATSAAMSDEEKAQREKRGVQTSILFSTRWVVFRTREDGQDILDHVTYTLDLRTGELVLAPAFELGGFDDDDELMLSLIEIHLAGVPLIAETPERQARLDALFRRAITTGIKAKIGDEEKRFRYLPEGRRIDREDPMSIAELANNHFPSPSETRIALQAMKDELEARDEAGRVLAALRLAISDLSNALNSATANEAALQRTLTIHPILFGPEYIRVQPEFPLGSDYRADYAVVRGSGLVDLVEIEASSHKLYVNKGKDPSAALTHAEQQVLDWLDLHARYGGYLQERMPGLRRPRGFVIIGRSATLSEESARKLEQRNRAYDSVLEVLTYDDVLDRAKKLLEVFEGLTTAAARES